MEFSPWTRYSLALRQVLFAAIDEAARRGETEVGAEHLLAIILRDPDLTIAQVLRDSGKDVPAIRKQLEQGLSPVTHRRGKPAQRLAPSGRRALELAAVESEKLRARIIDTRHVLLALIVGTTGPAGEVLDRLGFTYATAHKSLAAPRPRSTKIGDVSKPRQPIIRLPLPIEDFLGRLINPPRRIVKLGYDVFVRRSLANPGFVTNPYPLYRWLRDREPVREDPIIPAWVVTRYEDVATVMRDPRFKRDPFNASNLSLQMQRDLGVPQADGQMSADIGLLGEQMLFVDPPRHTRLRSLFTKAFTPRMVQSLRPRIEQIAADLIEPALRCGTMDLIKDVAYPLPTRVIAELLGFPSADYEKLKKWSDDFAALLGLNPSGEQQTRSAQSLTEMQTYFEQITARLRQNPGDNLLSQLLIVSESEDRLTQTELFANCVLLLAAGHETTTNLIGNGMLALLKHPDQLRLLRENPDKIEAAVEELLRYDSPVQWTSRTSGEAIDMGGRTFPPGTFVLASIGAANRDPRVFADPERLDISRAENKHLAFGGGIHFCLGAFLARLEGQIAINALLLRLKNPRVATRRLKWHGGTVFRGLRSLPLRFTPVET